MRKAALAAVVFVAAAIPVLGSQKAHAETPKQHVQKPKMVLVKKGDYLSKIARKHGTTYHRIFYANKNIEHPDLIYPNEKLRIPGKSEKLAKRPLPTDAHIPAETKADKEQNRYNYNPKPRRKWQPAASPAAAVGGGVWDRLAACESGGNWSINTGNGYYGGLQFSLSTWQSVGGAGYPHQASKAEQIRRGQVLQARSGWGQWPACASRLGLL